MDTGEGDIETISQQAEMWPIQVETRKVVKLKSSSRLLRVFRRGDVSKNF